MRILVLDGDGFCGWPTGLRFSRRRHAVMILDNVSRRRWDEELGCASLVPIAPLERRIATWRRLTRQQITAVEARQALDTLGANNELASGHL